MKKFIQSKYFTFVLAAFFSVAFIAFFVFNPSHAYFQVHKDFTGVNTAKVDLLFDKFDVNDQTTVDTKEYGDLTVNRTAVWGTVDNPYVIDAPNHISNLSVLQKSGYFNDKGHQCFFVVCTPTGYPVAIDCDGMEIAPIGSPARPFTGSIQGAPLAATDSSYPEGSKFTNVYTVGDNKFTVTQSTIADVIVAAADSTPDIGFFGRLSYNGSFEVKDAIVSTGLKDEEGKDITETIETTVLNGYAAQLESLLFADVTIAAKQDVITDIITSIEKWWTSFGTREVLTTTTTVNGDQTEIESEVVTEFVDEMHTDKSTGSNGTEVTTTPCKETHHLGIIAGHAEWASLKKISVYYSEGVNAFNLPSTMNFDTNFYSVVGLIGTAENVNPTYTYDENGVLLSISIQNAISDKQLTEDLVVGGGGGETGSFTGYMLAKNIFDMHEKYLSNNSLSPKPSYDVTEMKKENGDPFFSSIDVKEYPGIFDSFLGWIGLSEPIERRYYYFRDTIFTFAMSSFDTKTDGVYVPTGETDKIIEIWETPEAANYFYVTTNENTDNNSNVPDKWKLDDHADTTKNNYIYRLTAVDTTTSSFSLDPNSEYVIAYRYIEYALGENQTPTDEIIVDRIYAFDMNAPGYTRILSPIETPSYSNGDIESFLVANANATNHSLAFKTTTESGDNKDTAVTMYNTSTGNKFGVKGAPAGLGFTPSIYVGKATLAKGTNGFIGIGAKDGYWYGWDPARPTATEGNVTFPKNAISFAGNFTFGSSDYNFGANFYFDLASLSFGSNVVSTDWGGALTLPQTATTSLLLFKIQRTEETLPAKEFIPKDTSAALRFHASEDVLFYDGTSSLNDPKYIVTPLAQKKWNDGKGQYLLSINHAVKLARALSNNYKLTFSNLIEELKDFDTNTGGVIPVEIGTSKTYYTVPAGMIAFYISDADPKSEINIVVAVNPEQGASSIGLWGEMDTTEFSGGFDLTSPTKSFPLPNSTVPYSEADGQFFVDISGYYALDESNQYSLESGNYTTHLNGDVVLVGYTFEVTDPGIYLLGSTSGPMTVAYFSVTGAASGGEDGTGGSPLGDVDFVYANSSNTAIITVDKKFSGTHVVEDEDVDNFYYPSYYYIRMIPKENYTEDAEGRNGKIPYDTVKVRRYLVAATDDEKNRRRIRINKSDPDVILYGFSQIYQDIDPDNPPTS